jgi:hypothetical protein
MGDNMKINGNEVSKMMFNGQEVHGRLNAVDIEDGIITKGLVAWFSGKDFHNVGGASTLLDRSGNGNEGALSGFAYTNKSGLNTECVTSNKNLFKLSKEILEEHSILFREGVSNIENGVKFEYASVRDVYGKLPITLEKNTTYTISLSANVEIDIEQSDYPLLNFVLESSSDWWNTTEVPQYIPITPNVGWQDKTLTFTTPSEEDVIIYLSPHRSMDGATGTTQIKNFQIEEGETATEYEPFKGSIEKSVVFDGVDDRIYFSPITVVGDFTIIMEMSKYADFVEYETILSDTSTNNALKIFEDNSLNLRLWGSYKLKSEPFPIGEIVEVKITRENGEFKIYFNGVDVTTYSSTNTSDYRVSEIGGQDFIRMWDGEVKSFRLYEYAL